MNVNGEAVSIIKRRRLSSCGKYKVWYIGGINCSSCVLLIITTADSGGGWLSVTTAVVERHTLAMWPSLLHFRHLALRNRYVLRKCSPPQLAHIGGCCWPEPGVGRRFSPERRCVHLLYFDCPCCLALFTATVLSLRSASHCLTISRSAASNVPASSSKSARGFL